MYINIIDIIVNIERDILANTVNESLFDKQTIVIVTSNLVKKFNGEN